ncbi:MAG: tetratricopeptide repeat protein [Xanthomonadales bacterium]|nr:tetratricopeptide repeat protein [Xanthomonadales bacterium]
MLLAVWCRRWIRSRVDEAMAAAAERMKDPQRAKTPLDEAERWADTKAARISVLRQRVRLERLHGTPERELAKLCRIIDIDPSAAHAHGNLGAALLRMKRYGEAIHALERALALERYPLAAQQLALARQGLASNLVCSMRETREILYSRIFLHARS